MANETNYKFTKALIVKEDIEGTIPSNPAAKKTAGIINFTLKGTQATETNVTLDNNGQASKKDRGKPSYAGDMECKQMGDIMPILATHTIGEPDTVGAYSVSAWASTTAYTKFDPYDDALSTGDIVSHSNGTHYLVCYAPGTSGSTEPDLTGVSVGKKITDGTAEWIVVLNLIDYAGGSEACIPSATIEYTATSGCAAVPANFKYQFNGVYFNALQMMKQNGQVIHKYSVPLVAKRGIPNTDPDFSSIEDETGYSEVSMRDFAFKYDDVKILFDDTEPTDVTDVNITLTRNVTYEDNAKQDSKTSNVPTMTAEGSVKVKFTKEEYESARLNESFTLKFLFGNARGEIAHFTFNNVEKDWVDPDFSSERSAELTIPITADGNAEYNTLDYRILSQINYQ